SRASGGPTPRPVDASWTNCSSVACSARRRPTRCGPASVSEQSAEQFRLLRGELLVGEHPLRVELAELLQLLDRIGRRLGGRRSRSRSRLLLVAVAVLSPPALRLTAAYSVR